METKRRVFGWQRCWWAMALAAVLVCIPMVGTASAAPATGAVIVPDEPAPKPTVSIVGNVVVDKNKPTGFYELSLRVKTARVITLKNDPDTRVPESEYIKDLEDDEKNGTNIAATKYNVKNYPFESVAAAVYIDLDALSPVTWGTGKPIYDTWEASASTPTLGSYKMFDKGYEDGHPRGINLEEKDQPNIFTDLSGVVSGNAASVRLDTAHPDEITNATALIEKVNGTTALLTLTANTTTTNNVIYDTETPVVVVRFAYDLNRFKNTDVSGEKPTDFWVGLDKSDDDNGLQIGQFPLTYLAEGKDNDGGYTAADAKAAASTSQQTLWYAQNLRDDNAGQTSTHFYYYLGADELANQGTQSYLVVDSDTNTVPALDLITPKTVGRAVLARKDANDGTTGDPETAKYSFFQNLLQMGRGLILRMENAETYRKPTGSGGATVLFYDWDDSLIGALVVDPVGDVRAAVNEYVERVMIHEDLRTSENIAAAADLETLQTDQDYMDRVNKLERQYTYRGDYAYEVGQDDDDSLKRENGENFPLTNKLDYAFYRHVTTQTEVKNEETGITTRYFSTKPVSGADDGEEEYDGYLYPYIYGWAIVEDEDQDINKDNWILHKDAVKTEDVWTTFGVGELGSLDPSAGVTGSFVDPADGEAKPYTYAVTDQDAGWYFKLADFTAMENMLREGQDVLIVKAVYEPGASLLTGEHYTVVDGSLKVQRYSYAASTQASVYSFQYQYQRATRAVGNAWRGVMRTREPAVQTGYTYDVNAFDDKDMALDLDPTMDTNAFFLKTISNNDDILNIDVTTGGVVWKIDYKLMDIFGENISTGAQRSAGGELNLKNNFLYMDGLEYSDRQGTDGFVLQATMNTLLAEANKAARGEKNSFSSHLSRATLTDLNLRTDLNGTAFTAGNYSRAATYLQDLVTRLYNAGVSIDPKTGDVTLGWHQLQRHILLCMQAGGAVDGIFSGGTLMSETDCGGFTWCRLDDCSLTITVNIVNVGDIFVALDKAKGETGDKHPAKDALDKLMNDTPSLLDGYLNQFRKDEDGRKFKNRTEMMNALKDVYDILSAAGLDQDAMTAITKEQVQEIIITGKYPTTGKTYWWWNDGKRPITTWKDFIEAGMLVATGDVPDALDAMTDANLPNAVQNMISYAAPTGSPANVGWFRYKDSQEEDNEYTSVADFKADWIDALNVLRAKYTLPRDWNTIPWEEIQYALIHKSYKDVTSILSKEDYWWKDGGLPKLTYEKLLAAANAYRASNYTDSSELDRLLTKGINPVNNEVYLRRTVAGSGFTTVATFKTTLRNALTIIDYTSNAGTFVNSVTGDVMIDVYQMQYLLLNANKLVGKELPSSADIQSTAGYWWIPEPHVPTTAQNINDIMDLLTYAYWKRDGVGSGPLAFALEKLDAATMERLGLRPEAHGMPYTNETNTQLVNAVLAVLNKLPYTMENFGNQSAANLTREVQYALLHNAYLPAASITENYWWQGSGFVAETHEALAQAAWLAAVGFGGKTAPDAMNQITSLDFITRRSTIFDPGMAMRSNMDGAAFINIDAFKTTLSNAIKAAADSGITYSDLTGMTDYQLQYLLINGIYKSDAAVKAEVIVDGKDAYWWFTSDAPPEPDVQKEPIEVDAAEWDRFLTAAMVYFKTTKGNAAAFDGYGLTDDYVKNTLLLRKAGNAEITAAELFAGDLNDLLWQVMDALNQSSRKAEFIKTTRGSRAWVTQPTWAEFQYVLLHLNDVENNWTMPTAAECEAAKDGYDWMWRITGGAVEYEPVRPEDAEWDRFLTASMTYFKTTKGNAAAFDGYGLTDDYVKDTLLLRKAGNAEMTAAELFAGDLNDLLWQVMDALNQSSRKAEFIKTTRGSRAWVTQPTWAEFQYVLLHQNDVENNWTMPTTEECEAWATRENAPWAWQEKAAGASLLAIDLPEDETLEEEQVPLIWSPPDEIPPDKTSPERVDKDDSPGAWPPTADAIPEVPAGDEMFVVTLIKRDYQGGYVA